MPTTAEYLERLVQAKNNIADAITNAGGTVNSGDGLEDFSTDIGTIPIGGNIDSLTVYSNGTYTAPTGTDGYNPVNVYVANSYSASDEGKVVDSGALVSQTSTTKTVNGTYNTTLNNEVVINVPNTYTNADEGKVVNNNALVSQTSASDSNITTNGTYTYDTTYNNSKKVIVAVPNTYTNADEGKVVDSGALVSQTSTNINTNGTYNTTTNNEVVVAVPNTYTSGDEGKVVNNGALVSQTSTSITTNNTTVDTTLNNSVTVDIAIPQPTLITKSITSNGTYNASSDSADGYSSVSVTVPNTYSASDEGKVVSSGALVAQTSDTITSDGVYDTTLINSVTVSVGGGTPTGGGAMLYNTSSYSSSNGNYGGWYIGIADAYGIQKRIFVCGSGTISETTLTTKYVNPADITFSDYFSTDKTVTVMGYYIESYNTGTGWQLRGVSGSVTVVVKPSTNTVTLQSNSINTSYSNARYMGYTTI